MASFSYSACGAAPVGRLPAGKRLCAAQQVLAAHLLHLEDMLVEMLLQLLVRQIDAELLKVVLLEALEACSWVRVRGWPGELLA